MSEKISVKAIRLDGGTQSRAAINNDVVTDYSVAMKAGEEFPDIDVFFDGTDYWCGDGFHRALAAQRANIKTISARVHQGTRRDAMLFSAGANSLHGLRRTNEDKHRAVEMLLTDPEWGKWSNYEIARRCAVSEFLVRSLRPHYDLNVVKEQPDQRTYTNKHGGQSTMQTGNIGRPSLPTVGSEQSGKSVRYESDADADAETPDGFTKISYARRGTKHGEYNFTDDGDPIIYEDSFYAADYVKKRVIVEPFPSKDACWAKYHGLQAVSGVSFLSSPMLQKCEYFAPDVYAQHVAQEKAAVAGSIESAPVTPEPQALFAEPPTEDGDTQKFEPPQPTEPEQLPFTGEEPNDPEPFESGEYEVTPFGRKPKRIEAKPESSTVSPISAEAGSTIDTATSLREIAAKLSNSGPDTPISGFESLGLTQNKPAPAAPVDPRQNSINAFTSSQSVEWYTPAIYIASARKVMTAIDLDPASCEEAQVTVKATRYFTKEQDGLAQKWAGRVWLNPPYGRDEDGESTVAQWVHRVVTAYINHEIEQAVLLINATPDRAWFMELWAFPICFVAKRIKFYGPNNVNGNPTVGNAFVYLGENVPSFVEEFEQYGPIAFSTSLFRRNNVELADVFGELYYEQVPE